MSCFYFCFFLLIFVFKVLGSPRNEFRGKRTNPDQIGFGKCLTPTMKLEIENLPMKIP